MEGEDSGNLVLVEEGHLPELLVEIFLTHIRIHRFQDFAELLLMETPLQTAMMSSYVSLPMGWVGSMMRL